MRRKKREHKRMQRDMKWGRKKRIERNEDNVKEKRKNEDERTE